MEKHGSESYFVVGEGLLTESAGGRDATRGRARGGGRGAAVSLLAAWGRRASAASSVSRTARRSAKRWPPAAGATSQIPAGFTYLGPVHRPRPDLRQDDRHARREHLAGRAAAGTLAQPRPRLALRRRAPGSRSRPSSTRPTACTSRWARPWPPTASPPRTASTCRAAPGNTPAKQAQGDHPRPAQRREPRGRADAPGDDPLPQPRGRHAARPRSPPRQQLRHGARARDQALPVDDPHRLPAADLRAPAWSTTSSTRAARCSRSAPRRPTSRRCRSSSRSPPSGSGTR